VLVRTTGFILDTQYT